MKAHALDLEGNYSSSKLNDCMYDYYKETNPTKLYKNVKRALNKTCMQRYGGDMIEDDYRSSNDETHFLVMPNTTIHIQYTEPKKKTFNMDGIKKSNLMNDITESKGAGGVLKLRRPKTETKKEGSNDNANNIQTLLGIKVKSNGS